MKKVKGVCRHTATKHKTFRGERAPGRHEGLPGPKGAVHRRTVAVIGVWRTVPVSLGPTFIVVVPIWVSEPGYPTGKFVVV
jgi:hypothetical protein